MDMTIGQLKAALAGLKKGRSLMSVAADLANSGTVDVDFVWSAVRQFGFYGPDHTFQQDRKI